MATKGGRMSTVQVNPFIAGGVGLIVIALVAYFVFIKPGQDASKAAKDWISPEAAAARAPENRAKNPGKEAFLAQLRAKERSGAAAPAPRSRRRDE